MDKGGLGRSDISPISPLDRHHGPSGLWTEHMIHVGVLSAHSAVARWSRVQTPRARGGGGSTGGLPCTAPPPLSDTCAHHNSG